MSRVSVTALSQVRAFLSWWVTELRALVEDLRAHLAPRWRRSITVYVSRSRVQVADGDARSNSITIELPTSRLRSDSGASLPEAQGVTLATGRRARLVFDPEFAFIQSLHLPLAALPHLESAIALQKPKLLPLDAAALRTDFEVVSVDEGNATVHVELAAIKRHDIEPIRNAIAQWGLQLRSIHLGGPTDSRLRFTFGAPNASAGGYALIRTDAWLVASAIVLTFCAMSVFVVQSVRAQSSLDRALAETSTEAAAVLQERQQLISRLDTLSLIAESERAPTAAAVLADLTARLNRDAWLTTFELKGRDLRLVGLSSDPAALVKELAVSALISEVELRSSLSAASTSGKERFEITAQVKAVGR